jgi:hypothetical protein
MKYSLWQKKGIWYAGTYVNSRQYSISLRTKNKNSAHERAVPWLLEVLPEISPALTDILDFYLDYNPDRSDRTNEMAVEYMSEFIDYLGCNLHSSQISKDVGRQI